MNPKPLNFFCIFVMVVSMFGTAYVWRGHIFPREMHDVDPGIVLKTRDDFDGIRIPEALGMPEELLNATSTDEVGVIVTTSTTQQEVEAENDLQEQEEPEVREEISLNLDVPFTSQAPEKNWEQPWQDACEEAAALMMDAYYRKYKLSPLFAKDELQKMIDWEEQQGWGGSIEIEKVQQLFASKFLGHNTEFIENPTVEQIKGYLASGHPVFVVANGKKLPNPNFRGDGPAYHALVIRGYNSTKFITNDPGTQFGENFMYEYDDLMNAIADWNGGDVQNGRKVVLVVG
ncbi:C39 family peptidase [Candidatus Nomurabacteria bacterium]|nr:C39 family peptidase [Candidatus Nomurabacteria bacterium]